MKVMQLKYQLYIVLFSFLSSCGTTLYGQCYQYLGADHGVNQASFRKAVNLSLALDSAGTAYISYQSPVGVSRLVVAKNTSGNWSTLDTSWFYNKVSNYPNITVDKNGYPCVVYTDPVYKLSVARYTGVQWDTIGRQGFSAPNCFEPKLIFDKENTPYVIFIESSSKISVMKYDGTSWVYVGPPEFSSSNSKYLNISTDTSGVVYVAFRDGATNKATAMQFDGSNWVNIGAPGISQGTAWFITMALDNSGTPYVGYSDSTASSKTSVKKFDGTSWVYVGTQGFSPSMSNGHSLAIDTDGMPIISFGEENYSGTIGSATVMKFNGSTWSLLGLRNFSQGSVGSTSLAVTNSGIPIIAITDHYNNDKATVMKYNGSSWASLEKSGLSPGLAPYTSMTVDNTGSVYVAFQDLNNGKKASVMTYDGSSWINVGPVAISSCPAKNIHLVHDQSNSLYLSYQIDSIAAPKTIQLLKYSGGSWIPLSSPGSSSFDFDIRFDPSNFLYIAYSDSVYFNKLSVKKFNGSSWTFIGSPGFTTVASYLPSIDISPAGVVFVSYEYGSNLYVSRYLSGVWTEYTAPVASSPYCGVLRVGKSGIPFVLYSGSSPGGSAKLFQLNSSGTWNLITQGGAYSSFPRKIDLALDENENQYFVYPFLAGVDSGTYRMSINARMNNQLFNLSSPSIVNSVGSFNYPNLCFDTLGTLYAGYQDGGAVVEKLNTIRVAPSSVTIQNVCLGDTAVFSITAYSSLPLTYQWQVDHTGSGVYSDLSNDTSYSGVTTPSLSIHVNSSMAVNHYQCTISNSCYTYYKKVILPIRTPFVTLSSLSLSDTICLTTTPYIMTGEFPIGGTYSGYNISGNLYTADSLGSFPITYTYTNSWGCTSSDSRTIETVLPTVSVTAVEPSCGGTGNATIIGSGTPPFIYELDTLSQSSGLFGGILPQTNYTACMTDSMGCRACTSFIVPDSCDLVWPGDANNDMVVDNLDLLAIGIGIDSSGTTRSVQSNAWNGYPSFAWPQVLAGTSNYKHIDCNGDGTIDLNDTLAVNQNFGLLHAIITSPTTNQERLTAPDLYLSTSASSYNSGDIVDVEVWTGSSLNPVNNLYGLAFNINYTTSLVQPGTEQLSYPASWLGTPGTNAIKISKIDPLASTAYGAETRITHSTASGYGKIADFKFQLKNGIAPTTQMLLSLSAYSANDAIGTPIVFNTYNDSILINPTSGINEISNDFLALTIAPNPFTSVTTINFNKEIQNVNIKIIDVLGKEQRNINFSGKQLNIEKGTLQSGIYLIQIYSANELIADRKIIIQ